MGKRLDLHTELLSFAPNAYFQPPPSVRISYPCFVYSLSRIATKYASNTAYANHRCYNVTYISTEPVDDLLTDILTHFKYIRLDRIYTADELYHYVFVLFY